MRDRLIELLKKADKYASGVCTDYDEAQEVCADYLLAEGVIVPPVPLGSKLNIYVPIPDTTKLMETRVYAIGVDEDGNMVINPDEYPEDAFGINGYNIGKTVFLTREEAEKAIAERRDDET